MVQQYRHRRRSEYSDGYNDGHSMGDVWQAIGKQSEDIATVRTSVAALDARVNQGLAVISDQLSTLNHRANQPPPRPDVKGWVALAVSIAVVMGTIGWSNLRPVDIMTVRNYEEIHRMGEAFIEFRGLTQGRFGELQHRLGRLEEDSAYYHRRATIACPQLD